MTQIPVSTSDEQTIHAALELSKNSWLLAIQVPGVVSQGWWKMAEAAQAPDAIQHQPGGLEATKRSLRHDQGYAERSGIAILGR